jgi:hypothetical protein
MLPGEAAIFDLMRMRSGPWLMASLLHLTSSSDCLVRISDCSNLGHCML